MALLEQWTSVAYDSNQDQAALQNFWQDYFQKEKEIYKQLLESVDTPVNGTVQELADKYGVTVLEMTGF